MNYQIEICNYNTFEEHKCKYFQINLRKSGILRNHISVIICKLNYPILYDDICDALKDMKKYIDKDQHKVLIPTEILYITTEDLKELNII